MKVKRGDIVTVAAKGAYTGKPLPALIIQSDLFAALDSVTVCLLTGEILDAPLARITINPGKKNGLKKPCQVMLDKIVTVPREKIGKRIGSLDRALMTHINRSLALFLGIL